MLSNIIYWLVCFVLRYHSTCKSHLDNCLPPPSPQVPPFLSASRTGTHCPRSATCRPWWGCWWPRASPSTPLTPPTLRSVHPTWTLPCLPCCFFSLPFLGVFHSGVYYLPCIPYKNLPTVCGMHILLGVGRTGFLLARVWQIYWWPNLDFPLGLLIYVCVCVCVCACVCVCWCVSSPRPLPASGASSGPTGWEGFLPTPTLESLFSIIPLSVYAAKR
jgi:hypothetical protein